jgi:hypothetical protein
MIIFERILTSYRQRARKIELEDFQSKQSFRSNKTLSLEDDQEEAEFKAELAKLYPSYGDLYGDLTKAFEKSKSLDQEVEEDMKVLKKQQSEDAIFSSFDSFQAYENGQFDSKLTHLHTMMDSLHDNDFTMVFYCFKLLFVCHNNSITIPTQSSPPKQSQFDDALSVLRALAISAAQTAAYSLISALQIVHAHTTILTPTFDIITFPSQLYSISSAYLNISQHASLSGVQRSLEAQHTSIAASAALSTAASTDIIASLQGLTAILCPGLAPLPPIDPSSNKVSWKSLKRDTEKIEKQGVNPTAIGSIKTKQTSEAQLLYYDAWKDPNLAESQKLVTPVLAYRNRVKSLLVTHPSHTTLLQLLKLADRLSQEAVTAPIMRLLAGIESILKYTQLWDGPLKEARSLMIFRPAPTNDRERRFYTQEDTQIHQLYVLAARWRKLELWTWPMVLKRKDDEYETKAIPWWGKLYPMVNITKSELVEFHIAAVSPFDGRANNDEVDGVKDEKRIEQNKMDRIDAVDERQLKTIYDNYLVQIHTAFNEFLIYATLGEFKGRLALLVGLYNHLRQQLAHHSIYYKPSISLQYGQSTPKLILSNTDQNNIHFGTFGNIQDELPIEFKFKILSLLEHITLQFLQFLPLMMNHFSSAKKPLEQIIVEQVTLAVWDLSNFEIFQKSTEKSHQKVIKLSRDYDVILKTPIIALFQKISNSDVSVHNGGGVVHMGPVWKMYLDASKAQKQIIKVQTNQKIRDNQRGLRDGSLILSSDLDKLLKEEFKYLQKLQNGDQEDIWNDENDIINNNNDDQDGSDFDEQGPQLPGASFTKKSKKAQNDKIILPKVDVNNQITLKGKLVTVIDVQDEENLNAGDLASHFNTDISSLFSPQKAIILTPSQEKDLITMGFSKSKLPTTPFSTHILHYLPLFKNMFNNELEQIGQFMIENEEFDVAAYLQSSKNLSKNQTPPTTTPKEPTASQFPFKILSKLVSLSHSSLSHCPPDSTKPSHKSTVSVRNDEGEYEVTSQETLPYQLIDELTLSTIQRAEYLTSQDNTLQRKKLAVTDTLKLLALMGLSSLSSHSASLSFSTFGLNIPQDSPKTDSLDDIDTNGSVSGQNTGVDTYNIVKNTGFGNLKVQMESDFDIFSVSSLAEQHGNDVAGSITAQHHDIHTASLSLLSGTATARGMTRVQNGSILNILSSSMFDLTKSTDDKRLSSLSADERAVEFADISPDEQIGNAQRVFKKLSNETNQTKMLSLPNWYLNTSLSRSFIPSGLSVHVPGPLLAIIGLQCGLGRFIYNVNFVKNQRNSIPQIENKITPQRTANFAELLSIPTISPKLVENIVNLSDECDQSFHEVFATIRKMRVRLQSSVQRDVQRPQIDKLKGMIEHLFTLLNNTSGVLSVIAPSLQDLINWVPALHLSIAGMPVIDNCCGNYKKCEQIEHKSTQNVLQVTPNIPSLPTHHSIYHSLSSPITIQQLSDLVNSLIETAQGEQLLLQRLGRTFDQLKFPEIHRVFTSKLSILTSNNPLPPPTYSQSSIKPQTSADLFVEAQYHAACSIGLGNGLVPNLNRIQSQISQILGFFASNAVSPVTFDGVFQSMSSPNGDVYNNTGVTRGDIVHQQQAFMSEFLTSNDQINGKVFNNFDNFECRNKQQSAQITKFGTPKWSLLLQHVLNNYIITVLMALGYFFNKNGFELTQKVQYDENETTKNTQIIAKIHHNKSIQNVPSQLTFSDLSNLPITSSHQLNTDTFQIKPLWGTKMDQISTLNGLLYADSVKFNIEMNNNIQNSHQFEHQIDNSIQTTQFEEKITSNSMVPSLSSTSLDQSALNIIKALQVLAQTLHPTQQTSKNSSLEPKKAQTMDSEDENESIYDELEGFFTGQFAAVAVTTTASKLSSKNIQNGQDSQVSASNILTNIPKPLISLSTKLGQFTKAINGAISDYYQNIGRTDQDSLKKFTKSKQDLQKLPKLLSLLSALLHQVIHLVLRRVTMTLATLRSGLRFTSVLSNIFNVILIHGLCRKPDEKDDEEGDDDGEDGSGGASSGVGMGEGSGNNDVSDQIQDEEQLLGTKNERQEENNDQNEEPDLETGKDMENDFEGEMHSVPKKDQDEEDKDDDDGDDVDDREMGDMDENDEQDVVDEKMWNDKEDNQDDIDRSEEKRDQQETKNQGQSEKETVAKDQDDDNDDDDDDDDNGDSDDKNKDDDEQNDDQNEPKDKNKPEPVVEEGNDEQDEDMGEVNADDEDRIQEPSGNDMNDLPDDVQVDEPNVDDIEDENDQNGEENDDKEAEELDGDQDGDAKDSEEGKDDENDQNQVDGDQDQNDNNNNDDDDQDDETPNENTESNIDNPVDDGEDVQKDQNEDDEALDKDEDDEDERQGDDPQYDQQDDSAPHPGDDQNMNDDDNDDQNDQNDDENQQNDQQSSKSDQQDSNKGQSGGSGGTSGNRPPQDKQQQQQAQQDQNAQQKEQNDDNAEKMGADKTQNEQKEGEEVGKDDKEQERSKGAKAQPKNDQNGQNNDKNEKPQTMKNPYTSLGQNLEELRKRLEILEQDDAENDLQNPDAENDLQNNPNNEENNQEDLGASVEHAKDDEKAQGLVLADVEEANHMKDEDENDEQNVQKKPELNQNEQDEETNTMNDDEHDGSPENKQQNDEKNEKESNKAKKDAKPSSKFNSSRDEDNNDEDGTFEDQDEDDDIWAEQDHNNTDIVNNNQDEQSLDDFGLDSDDDNDNDNDDDLIQKILDNDKIETLSPEEAQDMRLSFDVDLDRFNTNTGSMPVATAEKHWQSLTTVTMDQALQLCEQLRIILEPTLAAKLTGDYRTGKRINIKKIIPFIASQFRKDQIWLRRTAPNKRNYQVLVAIDNSQSMRVNGACRMAMESLAILCQALTQLEVGEISVLSFGAETKLLLPFASPLTPQLGAYMVSNFNFIDTTTQWVDFITTSIQHLEYAKESSSTANADTDTLQLAFIISDARIQQDRSRVERLVKEAQEKGQLLCLLIIDSQADQSRSILQMKKMTLLGANSKLTSYLDGFPMPYYTIVSDVTTLPEIISQALREWFELVQK